MPSVDSGVVARDTRLRNERSEIDGPQIEPERRVMDTTTQPVAQPFSLRIERLAEGKAEMLLAQADELEMRIKVYAEGGENTVHAHLDHDHSFVVLDGEATFYDRDGNAKVLGRYEGIMLPRGTHYRFCNSGEGNLVVLRAGGGHKPKEGYARAIGKTGPANPALTPEHSKRTGVAIPGEFFGD
jgi:mannose-6-phosphate isomerase-like protein (cupin superfamily)